MGRLVKEFHRLMRRIDRVTDGQASIGEINWEDGRLDQFQVTIKPNGGYYKGGTFHFWVEVPSEYPTGSSPIVWCDTPIYHPNIDPTESRCESNTNVCLNILSSDWDQAIGLEGVVLGLIFLLYNPNPSDALSPVFDYDDGDEGFAEKVKESLAGGDVDGFYYEANNGNAEKENDKNKEQDVDAGDETKVSDDANADRANDVEGTEMEKDETECIAEVEEQANVPPRYVCEEEAEFRELMEKECTLQDDFEDDELCDKGLVMVDGECALVFGATESGVDVLNDSAEENEGAALPRDSTGMSGEVVEANEGGVQNVEVECASGETVGVTGGENTETQDERVANCTTKEECATDEVNAEDIDLREREVDVESESSACTYQNALTRQPVKQCDWADMAIGDSDVDEHEVTKVENNATPGTKGHAGEKKHDTNKLATKLREGVMFFTTIMLTCIKYRQKLER